MVKIKEKGKTKTKIKTIKLKKISFKNSSKTTYLYKVSKKLPKKY